MKAKTDPIFENIPDRHVFHIRINPIRAGLPGGLFNCSGNPRMLLLILLVITVTSMQELVREFGSRRGEILGLFISLQNKKEKDELLSLGRPVITSKIANWSVFVWFGWRLVCGIMMIWDGREPAMSDAITTLEMLRLPLSYFLGSRK